MADKSGDAKKSVFGKATKTLLRKAEKLKQKYSKEDHEDIDFQVLKANFEKQQMQAHRIVKDVQRYTKALEEMAKASGALGDSIKKVYEPEWVGSEPAYNKITELDQNYRSLSSQLEEEFVEPLKSYLGLFPLQKKRVDKHERRQLDHDRCKRLVEQGRQKGSKKINELEDQYTKAADEFKEINDEIYMVLPEFYEGRKPFYGQHFQTLFRNLAKFHEESAVITDALSQTMENLQVTAGEELSQQHREREPIDDPAALQTLLDLSGSAPGGDDAVATMTPEEADKMSLGGNAADVDAAPQNEARNGPPTTIEVRLATHKYEAQDDDELAFEKGETIYVQPFPDPDDEEEGWMYGCTSNGACGVFPTNFTKATN